MKNNDKNKTEINTTFPAEFPEKKPIPDNHIADVVVSEIKPPAPEENTSKS